MMTAPTRVLDHAPADWDALVAADRSASPSHQPLVWDAFTAALPGFEWRLLASYDAGTLVAGVPVLLERRGPFRWLHALPWMLSAAPLAQPGAHAHADRVLAPAFAELARREHVVGGEWACYRPGLEPVADDALAAVPGSTRQVETALLAVGRGLDACHAAMGRKARQTLEQAAERGLEFREDAAALDEAYALHVAQSRHWPGHRPLPLALSRRLLAARAQGEPVARLFTLRSAQGLESATLVLDGAHETLAWWAGTHPAGRRLQAFTLLMWRVAGWAAEHGRLRLNLGASTGLEGVSAFKRSLGADIAGYPVRVLDARHAGRAGRWLAALQLARRRRRAERA
ncbi:MAG: GNAT family N-acetyltransferase [Candidatus Eisenbacteria bacterium]